MNLARALAYNFTKAWVPFCSHMCPQCLSNKCPHFLKKDISKQKFNALKIVHTCQCVKGCKV